MQRPQTIKNRRTLLRDAQRYVRRHLGNFDLSLAEVAGGVGASPRQLQRVFREEGGEDFRAYLLRVRMTRARALLTREPSPLPVRAVCHQVGYRQPSGLRQAFLRYYGLNPSEVQAPPPDYDEFWRQAERRDDGNIELPRGTSGTPRLSNSCPVLRTSAGAWNGDDPGVAG
jgi:AraC-like DNA-binding protein